MSGSACIGRAHRSFHCRVEDYDTARRTADRESARAAAPTPILRDASLANAPVVNPTCTEGEWCIPSGEPDLTRDDQRLFVEIPARFGEMLHQASARARMASRHAQHLHRPTSPAASASSTSC